MSIFSERYDINYQLNYKWCVFTPDHLLEPHNQLYWHLYNKGISVSCLRYNQVSNHKRLVLSPITDDFVWHKPASNVLNMVEIIYCYGNGGQNLIVRHLSITDIIKGLKEDVFVGYKDGESWIEERNYKIIAANKLRINNPVDKVNYVVRMIKKQRENKQSF